MLFWGIAEARKKLSNDLSSNFDKDGFVVVQDDKRTTQDVPEAVAVLVRPELFRRYQEIARWYLLKEASEHPEVRAKAMEIADALSESARWQVPLTRFSASIIAKELFDFIEQQQKETLPKSTLSEEDWAAFNESIEQVIRERASPLWNREQGELEP
jgi:hypothetical protein